LIAALVSLTASIGPPGSASEIAMPATSGARPRRAHSSSVKSVFVDMDATLPHSFSAEKAAPKPAVAAP
jgi:hypothetical protein